MIPIYSNPSFYTRGTDPDTIKYRAAIEDALREAMLKLDRRARQVAMPDRLPKRSKITPVALEIITENPGITTPEINDHLDERDVECSRSTLDASLQALLFDGKIKAHRPHRKVPRQFWAVTDE